MSVLEKYSVTIDVENHLVHLSDNSIQARKKSNNNYLNSFSKITDNWEDGDPAVPTSGGSRLTCGYLRSYENRGGSSTRIWKKRRSLGLAGTSHLERGENDVTSYQSLQHHIHTP